MATKSFADIPSINLVKLSRLTLLTCYSFVMSDFKTIMFPVLAYSLISTPPSAIDISMIPKVSFWIFLHLLQFCAANQMYSIDEDALNKPYRPVPAGLITVQGVYVLRWALVPSCLAISYLWKVQYPGIALSLAFMAYNEFGLDSHWTTKSLLNAIGIVSWNIGAATLVRGGSFEKPEGTWMAPYLSVALIWSTIHTQDFRDEAGDRLQGRVTLPILMPEWSRRLTLVLLALWSFGLAMYWNIGVLSAIAFTSLGIWLGLRIFFLRTEAEDKISLRIYMIWLTFAQAAPFWTQVCPF